MGSLCEKVRFLTMQTIYVSRQNSALFKLNLTTSSSTETMRSGDLQFCCVKYLVVTASCCTCSGNRKHFIGPILSVPLKAMVHALVDSELLQFYLKLFLWPSFTSFLIVE